MGFHLMPRPEPCSRLPCASGADGAVALIDTFNLLENQHVVNGSTQLGGGGNNWSLQLPIYGPEKVVRAQMEYCKDKFSKIPGAVFTEGELFRTPLDAATLNRIRKVNFGIPDLSTFNMLGRNQGNPNPPGGHIGFSPIIPRTGEALLEYAAFYRDNLPAVSENNTLRFQGPVYMTNWDRTLVAMIMFPIGKDKVMNAKMRAAFEKWVRLAADRGWAEYRAPASVPGSGRKHLFLQQPFTDPDARDHQGRARSKRHPVAGALWRLAQTPEERLMRATRTMLALGLMAFGAAALLQRHHRVRRSGSAGACIAIPRGVAIQAPSLWR